MVSNTDLCKTKEKVRSTSEKSNRLSHVCYGAIGGDVKTVTKHRNNNEIAPKLLRIGCLTRIFDSRIYERLIRNLKRKAGLKEEKNKYLKLLM